MVLLSYLHMLRKIIEEPDILPGTRRISLPHLLSDSLSGAITLFCLRTVLRSRQHRVILSFYFGIGMALVLAYLNVVSRSSTSSGGHLSAQAGAPSIAASILMMFVAVGGMRIIAAIPIVLPANWAFRTTELHGPVVYLRAVRRAYLVLSVLPIWFAAGVLFFSFWPFRLASQHLLVLGLIGMVLVEICLSGFQKIPFTCSYLPGKGNLQYVFWFCALFLLPIINAGAQMEFRLLDKSWGYGAVVVVLAAALTCARWNTATLVKSVIKLKFNEVNPPEIFSLNLDRG